MITEPFESYAQKYDEWFEKKIGFFMNRNLKPLRN